MVIVATNILVIRKHYVEVSSIIKYYYGDMTKKTRFIFSLLFGSCFAILSNAKNEPFRFWKYKRTKINMTTFESEQFYQTSHQNSKKFLDAGPNRLVVLGAHMAKYHYWGI